MKETQERPDTINMLLDIEKFSGEHTGRMAPVMVFLLLAGAPALFIIYTFVGKINLLYFLPFYVPYAFMMGLITIGQQAKRVEEFKRQLNDQYSSALDLINIKEVHKDGCIEYVKGNVAYLVVATNGNITDEILRAQIIRRFFINLSEGYTVDVHIHNVVASDDLESRYDGVKLFSDKETARQFIDLIDYNRKIISERSLITQVVFIVKAKKRDFKKLKSDIGNALSSQDAKAFRALDLASYEKVQEILERDIDATVDFDEMQIKKYATDNYYGSKVIGYDLEKVVKEEVITEERGFMVHE